MDEMESQLSDKAYDEYKKKFLTKQNTFEDSSELHNMSVIEHYSQKNNISMNDLMPYFKKKEFSEKSFIEKRKIDLNYSF